MLECAQPRFRLFFPLSPAADAPLLLAQHSSAEEEERSYLRKVFSGASARPFLLLNSSQTPRLLRIRLLLLTLSAVPFL